MSIIVEDIKSIPYSYAMAQQDETKTSTALRYPAIQGLRGLAILLVLLCHMRLPFFENGFVGVDIFFVISGFLITRNMSREYLDNRKASKRQGWISFLGFYSRRARRIIPAAFAVVLLILIAWFLFPPESSSFTSVFADATWATFFVANLNFINQATTYFGEAKAQSPMLHYWSLSVEEQFYFFWPVFFLAVTSSRGFKVRTFVFNWRLRLQLAIFLLSAVSLAVYLIQIYQNSPSSYFSAIGRFWEFGIGAFFGLVKSTNFSLKRKLYFYPVGVILVSSFLVTNIDQYRILLVLPVFCTGLFLYVVCNGKDSGFLRKFFENRFMVYLGKVSFSLYLVHWPLIVFLEGHGVRISGVNLLWFTPLLFVLTAFVFREVEDRFMKLKIPVVSKRSAARRTRYFPLNHDGLKYGSVLIFAVILTINFQQGLRQPFIITFFQPKTVEFWTPPSVASPSSLPLETASVLSSNGDVMKTTPAVLWSEKIRSGLNAIMLPDGIQPDINELDSDRLAIWKSCLTVVDDSPKCNAGNPQAGRKVFVLGDSYALSSTPMVSRALSGPDAYVIARNRAQCMVPAVATLNSGQPDPSCWNHREKVNEEIKQTQPFLVIALSLNSNEISGSRSDLIKGMKEEYSFLVKNSKHVLVIGETPFTSDPRTCVTASRKLTECVGDSRSRSDFRELTRKYAEESGAKYLDITKWMCINSSCPMVIDGTFVTWDGGHLTRQFSEKLALLFQIELKKLEIL
jgi:peptidoglycan/LPS O-acetylase OafA/YrhL